MDPQFEYYMSGVVAAECTKSLDIQLRSASLTPAQEFGERELVFRQSTLPQESESGMMPVVGQGSMTWYVRLNDQPYDMKSIAASLREFPWSDSLLLPQSHVRCYGDLKSVNAPIPLQVRKVWQACSYTTTGMRKDDKGGAPTEDLLRFLGNIGFQPYFSLAIDSMVFRMHSGLTVTMSNAAVNGGGDHGQSRAIPASPYTKYLVEVTLRQPGSMVEQAVSRETVRLFKEFADSHAHLVHFEGMKPHQLMPSGGHV